MAGWKYNIQTYYPPFKKKKKMVVRPETMFLHSIGSAVWLQKYGNFYDRKQKYLSATATVILLLNRNNKDLNYKEVLLLYESPFEETKFHCILRSNVRP